MKDNLGRSFITIMIVIAVFAFCLRIALEQAMRISILHNQADSLTTIKLISTALENYAKDNNNVFPGALAPLTETEPAYLDRDYSSLASFKGYSYNCSRLEASGYRCVATPVKCGTTGQLVYSVTTGGSITQEACIKKE
ncbi:MAG: hypothetical protein NTU54_04190 [Candidatus Omnitrophica bacterium]|nr:hypothetical protein [Candidatus Omnitrophota bacterium]